MKFNEKWKESKYPRILQILFDDTKRSPRKLGTLAFSQETLGAVSVQPLYLYNVYIVCYVY